MRIGARADMTPTTLEAATKEGVAGFHFAIAGSPLALNGEQNSGAVRTLASVRSASDYHYRNCGHSMRK